ncbi:hypothetical protein PIROE2DRAFT_15083 [Piromyces sp. E2]|nr:hypothetical protein PIROE2DRAFT_15083 [Piromyces sp. E2]|eukprot:OUM59391.1 hypothetical protein PIROE2DRAFT_15083 [Piromyces sp. E2]
MNNDYYDQINQILLRRVHKIIVKNKNRNIDKYFKETLNVLFQYDLTTTSINHTVYVESCDLLNCVVSVDNTKLEFINGILINKIEINDSEDPIFMERIKNTVLSETENIREKLEIPLFLNEKLYQLGYCMSINLVKTIAISNKRHLEYFYYFLIKELKKLTEINGISSCHSSRHSNKINLPYQDIKEQFEDSDSFFNIYSKWLDILKSLNWNEDEIPLYFNNNLKINDDNLHSLNLKVISITNEDEFYQLMSHLIHFSESFSEVDLSDLNIFFSSIPIEICEKYIPDKITNKNNIIYLFYFTYHLYQRNGIDPNKIINLYEKIKINVDDIYKFAIILSFGYSMDIRKFKDFIYSFRKDYSEILLKLFKRCSHDYELFLNSNYSKYKWAKLTIQKDDYLSSSIYSIKVKTCHLLYCSLTLYDNHNHTTIIIEFENGELMKPIQAIDELILTRIKNIIKDQTKLISKKLFFVLSYNKNLLKFNYCIDTKLALKLSLCDDIEINDYFEFINDILNGREDEEDDSVWNNIRNNDNVDLNIKSINFTYIDYCIWLYSLESLIDDNPIIPMNYKTNFENIPKIKKLKIKINHIKINIIRIGEEKEFFKMITSMITSPEALSKNDIFYLKYFFKYEENPMEFIPNQIPNKENLAKIVKILIKYYGKDIPLDGILPLFKNVNDVLKLIFELSKSEYYDREKIKFKSFTNFERRLIMKLLNNLDDLLGIYKIKGKKENKMIRREYKFYKELYELDNRLRKYKEEINQFVELEEIIKMNDLSKLKEYIEKNNIESKNYNNFNEILIVICENNYISVEIAEYIIHCRNNKNLNYSINNKVPLFVAIANNNFKIATLLFKNEADISYITDDYYGFIDYVCEDSRLNIDNLKFILDYIDDDNNDLLNDLIYTLLSKKEKFGLLETVFNFYNSNNSSGNNNNNNRIKIYKNLYRVASKNENCHAFRILIENDNSDEDTIFNRIVEFDILKMAIKTNNYDFVKKILDYKTFTFEIKEESTKISLIEIINKLNEFIDIKIYKSFVKKIIICYQKYIKNKEKYAKIPLTQVINKYITTELIQNNIEIAKLLIQTFLEETKHDNLVNKLYNKYDIRYVNYIINLLIKMNNQELIEYLVGREYYKSFKEDINTKDINGNYTIIETLNSNNLNTFKYFIDKGVDGNIKNEKNQPLLLLTINKPLSYMKHLVDKCDFNGDEKLTQLIKAIKQLINDPHRLIPNYDDTYLVIEAAKTNNIELIKLLINYCKGYNFVLDLTLRDKNNNFTVLEAVKHNNYDMVLLLINYANDNETRSILCTPYEPLFEAINHKNVNIFKLLINDYISKFINKKFSLFSILYFDINKEYMDKYLLVEAVKSNNEDIVSSIIDFAHKQKHKLKINIKKREIYEYECYPIYKAVDNRNVKIVKLLIQYALDHNINLNIYEGSWKTHVLANAIKINDYDIFLFLLDYTLKKYTENEYSLIGRPQYQEYLKKLSSKNLNQKIKDLVCDINDLMDEFCL